MIYGLQSLEHNEKEIRKEQSSTMNLETARNKATARASLVIESTGPGISPMTDHFTAESMCETGKREQDVSQC